MLVDDDLSLTHSQRFGRGGGVVPWGLALIARRVEEGRFVVRW